MACMLCMQGLKFANCHRQHHQYNVWPHPLANFPVKENPRYAMTTQGWSWSTHVSLVAVQNFTSYTKVQAGERMCWEHDWSQIFWQRGSVQKLRAAISECWPPGGKEKPGRQVMSPNLRLHGDSSPPYAWADWHFCICYSNWKCALILRIVYQFVFRLAKVSTGI